MLALRIMEENGVVPHSFEGEDAIGKLIAARDVAEASGKGTVIEYRRAFINLENRDDGWWFVIKYPNFNAGCGNFVGPNTALATATHLIDVVMDQIL